jgi:hypothetical protein
MAARWACAAHGAGSVLCRAVLLPLSDDGGAHIDSVLGAANFRELHKGEDKELHTRLQVAILDVEKGQLWEVYKPSLGWLEPHRRRRHRQGHRQVAPQDQPADHDLQDRRDDSAHREISLHRLFVTPWPLSHTARFSRFPEEHI